MTFIYWKRSDINFISLENFKFQHKKVKKGHLLLHIFLKNPAFHSNHCTCLKEIV